MYLQPTTRVQQLTTSSQPQPPTATVPSPSVATKTIDALSQPSFDETADSPLYDEPQHTLSSAAQNITNTFVEPQQPVATPPPTTATTPATNRSSTNTKSSSSSATSSRRSNKSTERVPKLVVLNVHNGTLVDCSMENRLKTITFKFDISDVNPVDVANDLVRFTCNQ